MAGVIDALKLGWRSLGDDAARAAMGREVQQAARSSRIGEAAKTMSARQLADAMPEIEKYGVDFLNDFHSTYKQPVFNSMGEDVAYGVGRKLGGVAGAGGNMVRSMGGVGGLALQGAFMAPMIAPMFMNNEPQPSPEELQQQQLMQQYQQRHR